MQATELSMEGSGKLLDSKFSLMFGTQHAYSFLRMYGLLVKILADSKERLQEGEESAMQIDKPSDRMRARANLDHAKKCNYATAMASLQKVLSNGATALDFERVCRTASMDMVAQMAVLPKLVEKCADILCKLAKDQTIFTLHDYTMTKETDPIKLRSHCLAVSENACYRIQLDKVNGWMYFSYVEPEQELLEVPEFEEADEEEEEQEVEEHEEEQDEPMGGEENEGEADEEGEYGEDTEDVEDGEIEGPDSKRPKLE